jgi:hypothetical protein
MKERLIKLPQMIERKQQLISALLHQLAGAFMNCTRFRNEKETELDLDLLLDTLAAFQRNPASFENDSNFFIMQMEMDRLASSYTLTTSDLIHLLRDRNRNIICTEETINALKTFITKHPNGNLNVYGEEQEIHFTQKELNTFSPLFLAYTDKLREFEKRTNVVSIVFLFFLVRDG